MCSYFDKGILQVIDDVEDLKFAIFPLRLIYIYCCLKKNQDAPRPSEHPPVRGENVKTFRWDHRLQIQNLFMAFKRVPRWK